jgi:hypothetical protein
MLNFQYYPEDVVIFIEAEKRRIESHFSTNQQGTANYIFKTHLGYGKDFLVTLKLMCERLVTKIAIAPNDLWQLAMAIQSLPEKGGSLNSLFSIEPNISPVYVIHEVLKKCRDLPTTDRWPEILFLKEKDELLWERLSGALTDAQDALANGQFRAATVVSFHVLESLLGFWLRNKTPAYDWPKDDKTKNEKLLSITEVIKVCKKEGLFTPNETVNQKDRAEIENLVQACETAAGYRNLIHPDKTQRTKTDHDSGTAHSCLGTTLKLAQRIGQVL